MYHIPRERLIFGHRFLFKKESASNFLSNDILHDHIRENVFQTSPTRIPKRPPYWIFHFPGPVLVTSRSTQIFYIYLGLTKGTIPVWWVEKFFLRDCGRARTIFVSMTTEHKAPHFSFNSLCTCVLSIFINHYPLFLISSFHPSIGGEFKTLISSGLVYPCPSIVWVRRLG